MPPAPVIVAAMTRQRVIGLQGKIPWDLPLDRKLFRELTWGHCVIMGRLTFQSLPAPLPGRSNLVLSRRIDRLPGGEVLHNLSAALKLAATRREIPFVIGGSELYREALPLADALVISWVEEDYPGDRFFPAFDLADWKLTEQSVHPGFIRCRYRRAEK